MNLGDLTNLVEKPFAAMSNIVNTPNSAGRYRPFYLRNLLDAVQGRKLSDAVEGKTILITGGSSGIGEAAAKKIAEAGGTVALVARTLENLEKVADQIRGDGGNAHVYPCDLADMDAIAAMADQVLADLGGVDILINNAGTGSNETIMEAPDSKWDFYWDLHVMAAVRLARGLAPMMKKRGGGVILHNASICAAQPLWYEPIYNVTKAALMMFSKTLSTELIGDNIRVDCVNPGLILTPDWIKTAKQLTADKGGDWQAYLDSVAREHAPIKRFATPQELANFFVFLCSERASYSVGSTYYVDGGMLKSV
jgi:NAD(P)-dependent dehydrogenase (short-subunit alcohol dehydrogenase family)